MVQEGGGREPVKDSFFDQVYQIVREIPRGKVATYGQIAALLDKPRGARAVGWAMRACPEDVPWHRVINSQGRVSEPPGREIEGGLQQAMLEAEGVVFDAHGRVDLAACQWQGPPSSTD